MTSSFSNFSVASVREALAYRPALSLVMFGQSNERGRVFFDEAIGGVPSVTAYPQAYASQYVQAQRGPIYPVLAVAGGMMARVFDDLWSAGWDPHISNVSVGSLSMVRDACGQTQARSNNTGYRARRAPSGPGDDGYAGDLMVVQGRLFLCTAGNAAYASVPHNWGVDGLTADVDIITVVGTKATASSEPAGLATANVGDVITDGTIQWTCLATGGSGSSITVNGNYYTASVRLSYNNQGFDPFGLVHKAVREAWKHPSARRRIVVLQNAQGDVGNTAYQPALEAIASYLLRHGCSVAVGLSCWNPSGPSTAQYDALTTAVATTLSNLRSSPNCGVYYAASDVITGANLYTLMGSTGAMAAGGAYFAKDVGQDNLHLNAAGAVAAGGYVSAALLSAIGSGWAAP